MKKILANRNMPVRFLSDRPLNARDTAIFCSPGPVGYFDYLFLNKYKKKSVKDAGGKRFLYKNTWPSL